MSSPTSRRSTFPWVAAALTLLLVATGPLAATSVPAQNAAILAPVAVQPNGLKVELPGAGTVSRFSGLSLSVDTRWIDSYGYRPIQVTVTSPTPVTTDRLLTIRLRGGWQGRRRGEIVVERDFELPMGDTAATVVVSLPQYRSTIQYFWWEVWVDGEKDKELSTDRLAGMTMMIGGIPVNGYTMLVLGTAAENRQVSIGGSGDARALTLPRADLPTRWLDYSCFDVVSLKCDELRQVAQANPAAFAALCRWTRTGGQLWIEDVGAEWQRLPDVDELLGLPQSTEAAPEAATEPAGAANTEVAGGWRPVEFRQRRRRRGMTFQQLSTSTTHRPTDPAAIDRMLDDPDFVVVDGLPDGPRSGRRRFGDQPTNSARWYLQKPLGLGFVRAFPQAWDAYKLDATSESAPPATPDASAPRGRRRTLANPLLATRRWGSRHGLLPDEANPDFSRLLVPGVGLAPVTEFCVLISLFVIVIGPLNYWLLRRSHRVHLLVVTVPAAAAVVTLALFGYALLSDGLGSTVRVRSYTTLDQRTGEAVCWARLSYYAGLAPRRGLTMPSNAAVYPIVPGWQDVGDLSSVSIHRELEWRDGAELLTAGWLNSRTPTQYLSVRARQSPCRLELAPAGGVLRATNELGVDVRYVLAVDDAGQWYAGEHLAAGAATRLPPAARDDVLLRWRRLVLDNTPVDPPALAGSVSDLLRLQRRTQQRAFERTYGPLDFSVQRLANNLANNAIAELAGVEGRPPLQLPPRSYLAVTAAGPEVELGIADITEEASFHVLVGRW